ncbi:MAG: hypothetical protein WEC59_10745 [Salibacteraceae bacterium]
MLQGCSIAQKPFEGRIVYQVEYTSLPDETGDVEAVLPQQLTAFIAGENLRVEQRTALAGNMVMIHKEKADSVYQSFTFLDQQVMLVKPVEKRPMRYRVLDGKQEKEFLGNPLHLKKLHASDGQKNIAWVSESYINPFKYDLPELKHLPLVFDMERNGIQMHLVAIKWNEEPIDETYFIIDPDAKRVTESMLSRILD